MRNTKKELARKLGNRRNQILRDLSLEAKKVNNGWNPKWNDIKSVEQLLFTTKESIGFFIKNSEQLIKDLLN